MFTIYKKVFSVTKKPFAIDNIDGGIQCMDAGVDAAGTMGKKRMVVCYMPCLDAVTQHER